MAGTVRLGDAHQDWRPSHSLSWDANISPKASTITFKLSTGIGHTYDRVCGRFEVDSRTSERIAQATKPAAGHFADRYICTCLSRASALRVRLMGMLASLAITTEPRIIAMSMWASICPPLLGTYLWLHGVYSSTTCSGAPL